MDFNTKFFHNFSNHKKVYNDIWELHDSRGDLFNSHEQLEELAIEHFGNTFRVPKKSCLVWLSE